MLIYVSILPFVREEKNKRIISQSFTVRLRHFTKKSVLLPPFIHREMGAMRGKGLAKGFCLGQDAVSWVPLHCLPTLMGTFSYSTGV